MSGCRLDSCGSGWEHAIGFCEHCNVPSGSNISGSHFGVPKISSLLGYDAVPLGEQFPTFRKIILYLPIGRMSYHRRTSGSIKCMEFLDQLGN